MWITLTFLVTQDANRALHLHYQLKLKLPLYPYVMPFLLYWLRSRENFTYSWLHVNNQHRYFSLSHEVFFFLLYIPTWHESLGSLLGHITSDHWFIWLIYEHDERKYEVNIIGRKRREMKWKIFLITQDATLEGHPVAASGKLFDYTMATDYVNKMNRVPRESISSTVEAIIDING